jgi:hypothetical protein
VRRYGASGWHLMALLACFALTGYTVTRLLDDTSSLLQIVVWFVGAAVVWDLVLGPALALADRGLRTAVPRVPVLNYLRFPAGLSLLLLAVFGPLIFQRSEQRYSAASGLTQDPYLERWAAVTAALFVVSALAYGVRVLRARRG